MQALPPSLLLDSHSSAAACTVYRLHAVLERTLPGHHVCVPTLSSPAFWVQAQLGVLESLLLGPS